MQGMALENPGFPAPTDGPTASLPVESDISTAGSATRDCLRSVASPGMSRLQSPRFLSPS
jgi:hypothetical protein